MRVLIISDVHGNLPSLEFVLKKAGAVDLVISLGDVVNYGPWSNECVDLLDSLENKILILGNHEEAFIAKHYKGTNLVVKAFFEVSYPIFNRNDKIIDYVDNYTFNNNFFSHTINDSYIFNDSEVKINKNTFIGHSHRIFSRDINNFRLVNVGSVGQNRVNIDEVNYVIWDTEQDTVELIKKTFSADQLISEMKIKEYPKLCVEYILSKRN